MTNALDQPDSHVADPLVVRARSDRGAFGELYNLLYPPIFRYCIRRTGHRTLAEDVTSKVFLSVAKNIASFPGDSFQHLRRWVFTIATNEINSTLRKSARRQTLLIDAARSNRLSCDVVDGVDDKSHGFVEWDCVHAAIMRLPARDQAIITLRYFSELSYEDIGDILEMTSGAARTAATRALDKIRNETGRN